MLQDVIAHTKRMLAYSGDISWCVQYNPACQKHMIWSQQLKINEKRITWIDIRVANQVPDRAKLESANPPVKIVTTSHGGNPKSNEAKTMQVAGDKNAIVWQIFLTCRYKQENY